jgi:hypothetical protein
LKIANRIIIILGVVAVSILSVALMPAVSYANKTGNIKTINFALYWDQSCTNQTNTINWGNMEPNTTRSFTIYIKNIGTTPVLLSMTTTNWNPTTAQNYVTLTWNCENSVLNRASCKTATFTLAVSSEATGLTKFSFDTTITAVQSKS